MKKQKVYEALSRFPAMFEQPADYYVKRFKCSYKQFRQDIKTVQLYIRRENRAGRLTTI